MERMASFARFLRMPHGGYEAPLLQSIHVEEDLLRSEVRPMSERRGFLIPVVSGTSESN